MFTENVIVGPVYTVDLGRILEYMRPLFIGIRSFINCTFQSCNNSI